jgi:hypothetical protein
MDRELSSGEPAQGGSIRCGDCGKQFSLEPEQYLWEAVNGLSVSTDQRSIAREVIFSIPGASGGSHYQAHREPDRDSHRVPSRSERDSTPSHRSPHCCESNWASCR